MKGDTIMYFVDRSKIEETLQYMDGLLTCFKQETFETFTQKLALERLAHMCVESIVDVGNMMIDGFIMRDPGSYEDIIDILTDERVLPKEEEGSYKKVIQLRKPLVREFTQIEHDQLTQTLNENWSSLTAFSNRIRYYLNEELGPVSAFSKD